MWAFSMTERLHISSIVVTADPARLQVVTDGISAMDHAEVAIADPSGKLVVTLETPSEHELVEGLNALQLLPGVVSAALCFHHSEAADTDTDKTNKKG